MAILQEEVVALQVRADFLLNVVTQISRNNNQSWTMAIGLLDDVEGAEVSDEKQSPQSDQTDLDQDQIDHQQEQQPRLD